MPLIEDPPYPGNCLRLPLSSAIIMIIIVSRGLIELARAKQKQGTCQSIASSAWQFWLGAQINKGGRGQIYFSRGFAVQQYMLRRWPVKASGKHCSLLKGLCQNNPLLHHQFCPPLPLGLSHPYTVRTVPRLSACADQDAKPSQFLETALAWSRAAPGVRRKHSGHVLTNSYRYISMLQIRPKSLHQYSAFTFVF